MQLFDVDLFSSAGVQEMPANVVRGPEKTLAEKIAGGGRRCEARRAGRQAACCGVEWRTQALR